MMFMKKAGIVCCSNGIDRKQKENLIKLETQLRQLEIETVWSPYLFKQESIKAASAKQRADILMKMNQDETIDWVFDISGGDIANEILDELDFSMITKTFWGYSDLTTMINAIYSQTQRPSVLFQIRHIVDNDRQIQRLKNQTLFDLDYVMLQGNQMQGIVLGGNIRCFLKLAGTKYFPDMKDKLLLLEAYSGNEAKLITYLSQLKQMQVFEQIQGLVLGTFTEYFKEHDIDDLMILVKNYVPKYLPIVYTQDIGHDRNAKAIMIGKEYLFQK